MTSWDKKSQKCLFAVQISLSVPLEANIVSLSTKVLQTTWIGKKKDQPVVFCFFLLLPIKMFVVWKPCRCVSESSDSLWRPLIHLSLFLSVSTHFPDLYNNALTIKTEKAALQPQLLSLSFIKKRRRSPDGDGSMCLFVSLTQDFRYNSLPVYPSFPSSSDVKRDGGAVGGGGGCFPSFF